MTHPLIGYVVAAVDAEGCEVFRGLCLRIEDGYTVIQCGQRDVFLWPLELTVRDA